MKKEILFLVFSAICLILVSSVYAEKLEIKINSVKEGNVNFQIVLYDDNLKIIKSSIDYVIQDYYTDEKGRGILNSGEETSFKLPSNPRQGPWKISASFKDVKAEQLFNVGDLERAEIKLEGDTLIIENTGNIAYDKNILIYIGEEHQTARVFLDIGQTKKIRLTAPEGKYTIKVSDGTEENNLVFQEVSLTGNVIGLEGVMEGGFWERYPLVSLFLGTLFFVVLIIVGLKIYNRFSNDSKVKSKK